MNFCKLANVQCTITQTLQNADTFNSKNMVKGLKDCSERTCTYRGQEGCLLRSNLTK